MMKDDLICEKHRVRLFLFWDLENSGSFLKILKTLNPLSSFHFPQIPPIFTMTSKPLIRIYADLTSQPARAVIAFCKFNNIPH